MMKDKIMIFLIAVLALISNKTLNSQGLIANIPLDKRVENSSFVLEGRVLYQNYLWDSAFKSIYTVNTVLVLNIFKGSMENDTINIITPGGIVDDTRIEVFPSLKLNINDLGLFILNNDYIAFDQNVNDFSNFRPEYSRLSFVKYDLENLSAFDDFTSYPDIERDIYGKSISKVLKYDNKLKTYHKQKTELRSPNAVSISSFTPTTITAGTQSVLTINGSGFGSSQGSGIVEFRNADNGGSGYMSPIASEYVSWSDTQIKVEVPSGAGTGDIRVTNDSGSSDVSSTDLTVRYNLTNINYSGDEYRPNLIDADGSGGIEFVFYTDFYNDANALGAFTRALDSWRCGGGTGVYFEDGGSSNVDQAAGDNVNIVRFDNGSELPSNVLGRTTVYSTGCTYSGGATYWYVDEVDMVFNDTPGSSSYSWNFDEADGSTTGSEYDFESVSVHELGHAHQLGHVIDASQVMHYSIANGQEKRDLSSDDLDAGNDVLSFSSGVCGQTAMSSYICSAQPLDLIYFEGRLKGDYVDLSWGFDHIDDLDHIDLLKSENGLIFNTIMTFNNKNVTNDFEYMDNVSIRNNYYRLKYVDSDGLIKHSKIIFIYNDKIDEVNDIKLYPNPVTDFINIENSDAENSSYTLINSEGEILWKMRSVQSIDMSSYPEGVYFIKITTPANNIVKKFYKVNH